MESGASILDQSCSSYIIGSIALPDSAVFARTVRLAVAGVGADVGGDVAVDVAVDDAEGVAVDVAVDVAVGVVATGRCSDC